MAPWARLGQGGAKIGRNPTDRGKAGSKRSILVEGGGGPLEARGRLLTRSGWRVRRGAGVEGLQEDAFDAADVGELEGVGALAGGFQAGPAVLVAEAQELLRLP